MADLPLNIPEDVLRQYAMLLEKQKKLISSDRARADFMSYTKSVWPEFIEGKHHKIMGEKFNALSKEMLTSEPFKQALIAALFCAVVTNDKQQKVKRER